MFKHIMIFCAGLVVLSLALTNGMPKLTDVAARNKNNAPEVASVATQDGDQQGQPKRPLSRQVTLNANAQGHFEADFRINGSNVHALIDTGATSIAMNEATARRAGVQLSTSDFTGTVKTANGETRAAPVMLDKVQIGNIVVHDVEAVVLADTALEGTLVGMSFLNRLKGYEAKNRRLILSQ